MHAVGGSRTRRGFLQGDRLTNLTLQAVVRGLLDPSEFRQFDPRWRLKTRLLLDALERDNTIRWVETLQRHNTAVLQISDLDDKSFKNAKEITADNLDSIEQKLFPYIDKEADRRKQVASYRDMYIQAFGDWENDPVAKARLDSTIAMLEKRAEEGRKALARMHGRTV